MPVVLDPDWVPNPYHLLLNPLNPLQVEAEALAGQECFVIGWQRWHCFHSYSLKEERCYLGDKLASAKQAAYGRLGSGATRHVDFDTVESCPAGQAGWPHHLPHH